MADDVIKDINPNIGTYDNGDGSDSIAVKDFNSDALLIAWQIGG